MSQNTERQGRTLERVRLRPPSMYDIVMYNDDLTPMDFVVLVLMNVFEYSKQESLDIMLAIHHSVSRVVGTYPRTIAEYKLMLVEDIKSKHECTSFRVEMVRAGEGKDENV